METRSTSPTSSTAANSSTTCHPCSLAPTYQRIRELRDRHVIVAGFGPVGRMSAKQLEASELKVTIIELNLETVERQLKLERDVVYGSVQDAQTLKTAGIERAEALILTIPDEAAALEACRVARSLNPDIFIAARTNFLSQGLLCTEAGADQVVVEEVVTAEAMRRATVDGLTRSTQQIAPGVINAPNAHASPGAKVANGEL